MLKNLLTEDLIKLNIECNNWEEAIKEGTDLLMKKDFVNSSYEKAIIRNFYELGPYMVIAPGIVLSHARPEDGVNNLALSLITLKSPLNFGNEANDPVKLIFTLSAIDNEGHINVLKELMDLLMDEKDLNLLMNSDNTIEAIKIINKHSY